MRSTSCYAVLPSTNGQRIDSSYSDTNLPKNGKKSTTPKDILQSNNDDYLLFFIPIDSLI